MFNKKLFIATLIATLISFGASYLWYEILMGDFFTSTPGVTRDPVLFPLIILGTLLYSFAFCRLYQLCFNEEMPIVGQAIQYGSLIGILAVVATALFRYATLMNVSSSEVMVDGVFNFILTLITAVAIALYFGPEPSRGGGGHGGDD